MATKKQREILEAAGYVPKMGRPIVGTARLPAATVPEELRLAVEAKQRRINLPRIADAIRAACEDWVGK
jgi:hypothetical protein